MSGWSESPCIFGFESFLTFVARSKPGEEKEGIAKRPALKILTSWKWWWNLKERGEVPRFPVSILQRFHQGPPPGRPQSPDVNASSLQIKTCKQSNQCKQFMGRCFLHIWVSYSTFFFRLNIDFTKQNIQLFFLYLDLRFVPKMIKEQRQVFWEIVKLLQGSIQSW